MIDETKMVEWMDEFVATLKSVDEQVPQNVIMATLYIGVDEAFMTLKSKFPEWRVDEPTT